MKENLYADFVHLASVIPHGIRTDSNRWFVLWFESLTANQSVRYWLRRDNDVRLDDRPAKSVLQVADLGVRQFRRMKCDSPLVRAAKPTADHSVGVFNQDEDAA